MCCPSNIKEKSLTNNGLSDENISKNEQECDRKSKQTISQNRVTTKRSDRHKKIEASQNSGINVKIPGRKESKRTLYASLLSVQDARIPRPSVKAQVSLPNFVGSAAYPILTNKINKFEKSREFPTKALSECSGNDLKIQEGIKPSNNDYLDVSKDLIGRGYKFTLRQRFLGISRGSSMFRDITSKMTGKAELAAFWLQLAAFIENAMASKIKVN